MVGVTSREEEIQQLEMERPHLVILGAGASRAALPGGDAKGKILPVMADFGEVLGIGQICDSHNVDWQGRNFEELYGALAYDPSLDECRQELERLVFDYFGDLELPSMPTVYDYLLLSLRPKDIVATFNWDPFLIQAARRAHRQGEPIPKLAFLHGNVAVGFCSKDSRLGVVGQVCSECRKDFTPTPLLFPVHEKNYEHHQSISLAWKLVKSALKRCFMVTIFGYGAPVSDASAVELMLDAWGGASKRAMEQFEIIDIRDEESILASWRPFIHTHHYDLVDNYFDSWIARHPRRTGEAYINQYIGAQFIENNPAPREVDLGTLKTWFNPLLEREGLVI